MKLILHQENSGLQNTVTHKHYHVSKGTDTISTTFSFTKTLSLKNNMTFPKTPSLSQEHSHLSRTLSLSLKYYNVSKGLVTVSRTLSPFQNIVILKDTVIFPKALSLSQEHAHLSRTLSLSHKYYQILYNTVILSLIFPLFS
jgi:hypothetical protein